MGEFDEMEDQPFRSENNDFSDGEHSPQFRAKKFVADYWNEVGGGERNLSPSDIYVVWFAYILGGWKCVLSSHFWDDSSYFEITYDFKQKQMYLDHYRKVENRCLPDTADYRLAKLRQKLT